MLVDEKAKYRINRTLIHAGTYPTEPVNSRSIAAIVDSSSNSTLGLPQSLLTYPIPSNQSDTHRIKDLDIYHNNKGDIAV